VTALCLCRSRHGVTPPRQLIREELSTHGVGSCDRVMCSSTKTSVGHVLYNHEPCTKRHYKCSGIESYWRFSFAAASPSYIYAYIQLNFTSSTYKLLLVADHDNVNKPQRRYRPLPQSRACHSLWLHWCCGPSHLALGPPPRLTTPSLMLARSSYRECKARIEVSKVRGMVPGRVWFSQSPCRSVTLPRSCSAPFRTCVSN
jgi:hypothetical protein